MDSAELRGQSIKCEPGEIIKNTFRKNVGFSFLDDLLYNGIKDSKNPVLAKTQGTKNTIVPSNDYADKLSIVHGYENLESVDSVNMKMKSEPSENDRKNNENYSRGENWLSHETGREIIASDIIFDGKDDNENDQQMSASDNESFDSEGPKVKFEPSENDSNSIENYNLGENWLSYETKREIITSDINVDDENINENSQQMQACYSDYENLESVDSDYSRVKYESSKNYGKGDEKFSSRRNCLSFETKGETIANHINIDEEDINENDQQIQASDNDLHLQTTPSASTSAAVVPCQLHLSNFHKVANNSSKFKCERFQMSFTSNEELTDHVKQSLSNSDADKKECSQTSIPKAPLFKIHKNETPSQPPTGNEMLSMESKTVKTQTAGKSFVCEFCHSQFAFPSALKVHVRIHTKEKPYKCEFCDAHFSRRSTLNRHIRTHTKEQPYQCDVCLRAFSLRCHLKDHVRTHTKEKPYQCNFCDKAFSAHSTLAQHVRIHTNEKPYDCYFCDRSFTQISSLKAHLRSHTKERPFPCNMCGSAFGTSSNLNDHMRTHFKIKSYVCEHCGKGFGRNAHLKEHYKTHREIGF